MGWNSWNRFGCNVSEKLVREIGEAMVKSGMRDAGYRYVVIDDCWQVARDSDGALVADKERFPGGMKALADHVHGLGLKFGLYTDAGRKTCEGRPGSYEHEAIDARSFAAWGVDYTKVDWCHAEGLDAPTQFAKFRDALAAAGRPIVFSICEWGANQPWRWAPDVGHLWRTTGDIGDSWSSMLGILDQTAQHGSAQAPGGFNDPDMLEVGNGGMTDEEYRAHFSLWAVLAAPLIAGNDVRNMSEVTRAILTNREVIAVDQDPLGMQGTLVASNPPELQVWTKPLADGSKAVVLLNRSALAASMTVRWSRIGLTDGQAATVRDLWAHQDRGTASGRFSATVAPHGAVMLRVTPAAAK
jgi:alpha-galactosidase